MKISRNTLFQNSHLFLLHLWILFYLHLLLLNVLFYNLCSYFVSNEVRNSYISSISSHHAFMVSANLKHLMIYAHDPLILFPWHIIHHHWVQLLLLHQHLLLHQINLSLHLQCLHELLIVLCIIWI